MESRNQFRKRVQDVLEEIGPETFVYDESEFWMVQSVYEYVEYYAVENRLFNTAIALPLVRGLHNGAHRKSSIVKEGVKYRLPYLIHPLMVCKMLVDLQAPLPKEEEDVLLAAALGHDLIEDYPFPEHGKEMMTKYHLDKRVYDVVLKLSKRYDFTEEEEKDFFHTIESDYLALLVKLSDRGNNVEDLYNMSVWKVHEYVGETRKFFLPMCNYARENYPDLAASFEILENKIIALTQASEILVDRYDQREQKLRDRRQELSMENARLRAHFHKLWDEM